MADLVLKPGREKSLLRKHPWIFSGAVHHVDGNPASGETVNLLSFKGDFLARAAYSPHSQIRARVWTFDPDVQVNFDFFRKRIRAALRSRETVGFFPGFKDGVQNLQTLVPTSGDVGVRLIYAESDGLPGLIVDRYGDVLVLQSLTAGSEFWKETLADILLEETGLDTIYERSDADVRALEGLQPVVGVLRGTLPDSRITIHENGLQFNLNLESGHKTGFYLDQRKNRLCVRELAKDRDVLDCFCYTGGFTLNALAGGAKSVVAVDSSAEVLSLGRENVRLNGKQAESVEWHEGDVFHVLRKFRDEGSLIRYDYPRSSEIRAYCGAGQESFTRLQGYQFTGVQAAAAGRNSGHVLVLGWDRCGLVPENRRFRRFGCRCGCANRGAFVAGGRSSGRFELPGRGLSERVGLFAKVRDEAWARL